MKVPLLQGLPDVPDRVVHGFTTRRGGRSVGPLATLNMARRPGEDDATLVANWDGVLDALAGWSSASVALVEQVHEADVLEIMAPTGPLNVAGRADAMITVKRGVALAIRTADCVPVLLAVGHGVGAVHAGWRGVAAGVVPATVAALCIRVGCQPGDVRAVIGPHVSAMAYEVGQEVVDGIRESGVPEAVFVRGRHVDLRAAVFHQLSQCGVTRVGHVHRCTGLDAEFYSHRHDGSSTGRQASVIGLLP